VYLKRSNVRLTKYYRKEQIQKNVMGVKCGSYVGEVHTGIWLGNLSEGDHFEGLGIDGTIILKGFFKK
jgi:hypothetical protein